MVDIKAEYCTKLDRNHILRLTEWAKDENTIIRRSALTELAVILASLGLRTRQIIRITGGGRGGLKQNNIFQVWEFVHGHRPPSGLDLSSVIHRFSSVRARQHASSWLGFYVSRGGKIGGSIEDNLVPFILSFSDYISVCKNMDIKPRVNGREAVMLMGEFEFNTVLMSYRRCRKCNLHYLHIPEFSSGECIYCK